MNREILQNEAVAYQFYSATLKELPTQDWLLSLVSEKVFESVPFAAEQKDTLLGAQHLLSWSEHYLPDEFDRVYSDYMRLFIGPGKPLAPPWSSTYTATGESLLFQEETLKTRNWFRSFGYQISELYHEPDDHIAYLLEFMGLLSIKIAEALEAGDEKAAQQIVTSRVEFMQEHLLKWVDAWSALVATHAKSKFYPGIALLVQGALAETSTLFSPKAFY